MKKQHRRPRSDAGLERIFRLYDYDLPKNRIALRPSRQRDQAKLLVYNRKQRAIRHTAFRQLPELLPPHAVLVVNTTKVIPARLIVHRATGGKVEALFVRTVGKGIEVLLNRKVLHGERLQWTGRNHFMVRLSGTSIVLLPSFTISRLSRMLTAYGITPLPPYLRHSVLTEAQRRRQYQTVFAKTAGSIAAPTASLHFTQQLLRDLKKRGISICSVTLHVGLGTFAPLTGTQLASGKLHQETYQIDRRAARTLNAAKAKGRPIIAVGTTVVRTLETATHGTKRVTAGKGTTTLFLRPGSRISFVDGLITNFHVPRSSLLMLVAAFVGRTNLLTIYREAHKHRYRFLSFGDAMYIKPNPNTIRR